MILRINYWRHVDFTKHPAYSNNNTKQSINVSLIIRIIMKKNKEKDVTKTFDEERLMWASLKRINSDFVFHFTFSQLHSTPHINITNPISPNHNLWNKLWERTITASISFFSIPTMLVSAWLCSQMTQAHSFGNLFVQKKRSLYQLF